MANKMRSEVAWDWDGTEMTLRLSNNDLLSLESALEGTAGQILNRISENEFGIRDCMQILQRALVTGARLNRKQAQKLLEDVPLMEMLGVATDCLLSGYGMRERTDDEDAEDDEDAKKGESNHDPF